LRGTAALPAMPMMSMGPDADHYQYDQWRSMLAQGVGRDVVRFRRR